MKKVEEYAQIAADTFCEIMSEDRACDKDCYCWKQNGGGCEQASKLFSNIIEADNDQSI
jgi:hypothetical protein